MGVPSERVSLGPFLPGTRSYTAESPFTKRDQVKSLREERLEHKALLLLCSSGGGGGGEVEERARISRVGELIEAKVVGFGYGANPSWL